MRYFTRLFVLFIFFIGHNHIKIYGEVSHGQNISAGREISILEIRRYGIDRWFTENEIDNNLFSRINGKSYKSDCTVPIDDLRYLTVLHYDLNGDIKTGELICNKRISKDLLEIFRTLFEAKYPIEKMVLIDNYDGNDELSMEDNNTSAFNFRTIAGSQRLSKHSLGLAIDINPKYNPNVRRRKISPKSGADYADRTKKFPYKIDKTDLCYKEFIKHGFTWGGNWRSNKDYQHFEKNI